MAVPRMKETLGVSNLTREVVFHAMKLSCLLLKITCIIFLVGFKNIFRKKSA